MKNGRSHKRIITIGSRPCRTAGMTFVLLITVVRALAGIPAWQTSSTVFPSDEMYESAVIDSDGNILITSSGQRRIVVPKEGEQTSFSKPILSSDRRAVGAQALYPNCCTSYDIPLQLVIYARGRVHRFTGVGLPIFEWHFADRGRRVAFGQEPVHFGCEIHYELRDIDSEHLIDSANIPQPCGQIPDPPRVTVPKWVTALVAGQ